MDIRTRIWYDLYNCKYYDIYFSRYLRRSKNAARFYKAFMIICSLAGAITWQFYDWIAMVACVAIIASQMLEKLQNLFVLDDKELTRMGEYRMLYAIHFDEIDKLWTSLELGEIDDIDLKEQYFELRKRYLEIARTDNTFNFKEIKKIKTEANNEAAQYVNEHFFTKPTEHEQEQ